MLFNSKAYEGCRQIRRHYLSLNIYPSVTSIDEPREALNSSFFDEGNRLPNP